MSLYAQRGVSAQKEEVHAAIQRLDQGIYPHAFCKIYPDHLCGDPDYVNIMHADGAGTKSILAYLYWKETGDVSVWAGIAQDAVAMNLDDLLCVGVTNNILFSSTIDRNKLRIPGEVLKSIIEGTQAFFDTLQSFGVHIHFLGGETADVGDLVRTIAVNGTMTARWPKAKLVTNEKIQAGDVIIGFASDGQTVYENAYNSGLGSNGLTSARHDSLSKHYAAAFPESFESALSPEVVYLGKNKMTDLIRVGDADISMGKLLLSPTRTYAPLINQLLAHQFQDIHGMVHCSGGGQTKCLKYMPQPFHLVKDNLFPAPPIFDLIQANAGADAKEMYQVFNMGHRLEVFAPASAAPEMMDRAAALGIGAQIVGRVEAPVSTHPSLTLSGKFGQIIYGGTQA
jgi:phosphoribosylformylglycinamidine cyclo-ligase